MMVSIRFWPLVSAGAAVLTACAVMGTNPPQGKVFSLIDPGGMPPAEVGVQLPDTVDGSVQLLVRFNTWGSSTCTRAAGEDVAVSGQVVQITPYDEAIPPNTPCTADLRRFTRQTSVQPPRGTVTFQLRGLAYGPPGTGAELVTRTRVVHVR